MHFGHSSFESFTSAIKRRLHYNPVQIWINRASFGPIWVCNCFLKFLIESNQELLKYGSQMEIGFNAFFQVSWRKLVFGRHSMRKSKVEIDSIHIVHCTNLTKLSKILCQRNFFEVTTETNRYIHWDTIWTNRLFKRKQKHLFERKKWFEFSLIKQRRLRH